MFTWKGIYFQDLNPGLRIPIQVSRSQSSPNQLRDVPSKAKNVVLRIFWGFLQT
jgi:hypothetical protein